MKPIAPGARLGPYEILAPQMYVRDLLGEGIKRQLSTDGGNQPVWSRNGRELFYRSQGRFMVVPITSLPSGIGKPIELPIRVRLAGGGVGHPGYDVSPDGRRVLAVEQADEEARPRELRMVLNWFADLKARVSSK